MIVAAVTASEATGAALLGLIVADGEASAARAEKVNNAELIAVSRAKFRRIIDSPLVCVDVPVWRVKPKRCRLTAIIRMTPERMIFPNGDGRFDALDEDPADPATAAEKLAP
ncbi:hypothetical protein [Sphingopyxis sp.]|uniref:hypothetical protein n=1 Tax=Sphingopyxis sp. TaxID=1908224 RepID=UPI00260B5DBC|nr:hypothetical protein [Sphingopyxis sp.]MCW0199470.1 hypothetical protein [Sphingopyxis sp.]